MKEAVIVSTARTPIGRAYRGAFNDTHGAELGAHAVRHSVERAGIDPAEVADVLSEKHASEIVLVGGSETEKFSEAVASAMRTKAIDMTGNFLLGELAEFLSRCLLFISNDSGPVHVASSVGTPSVVIFGRKDPGLSPERWGPIGASNRVLHKDVGCDICLAHNCVRDFACLKAASSREVISLAEELLTGMA